MQFSRLMLVATIFLLTVFAVGFVVFRYLTSETRHDTEVLLDEKLPIPAFIVPHHLVAEDDIDRTFRIVKEKIGDDPVERIVLLSPNHFDVGRSWIIGSARDWETSLGTVRSDKDFISVLDSANDVVFGEDLLDRDHGIRNLLPFIAEYFPQAIVTPLVLRDGIPESVADSLAETIDSSIGSRALVIVSSDFSHYLDWNFSRFHDEYSIRALQDADFDRIGKSDSDCVGCLRVASQFSRLRGALDFQLTFRSSALESVGKNTVGEETSHVSGYFSSRSDGHDDNVPSVVSMLFSGQLQRPFLSMQAQRLFMGQDVNVFDSGPDGRIFFDVSNSLFDHFDQVSLGDGKDGYSVLDIAGRKVTFVGVVAADIEKQREKIRTSKASGDIVIAYWREAVDQSVWQQWSRAFAESGADAVFGRQSFEPGLLEVYQGVPLFPSLGFSVGCGQKMHCNRLAVGVSFSPSRAEYFLMPVVAKEDGEFVLATGEQRVSILERVASGVADEDIRKGVLDGVFVVGR
jgi:AmmeMemoRadiSam system protein B